MVCCVILLELAMEILTKAHASSRPQALTLSLILGVKKSRKEQS